MCKPEEFDNILDECLERVLVKGETIEQCLESYPQQADELKPLLLTALSAKRASAIQPHPEFKARARYQLLSALQSREARRSRFFNWRPRWATAIAIVLALLLAGGGTVAAASGSMPDETLYPVKLATEQVQLALTPSDLGKAQFLAELADKRVTEIIYLASQNKPGQIESTTQRLETYLAKVAVLATDENEGAIIMMAPATEAETAPQAQGRGAGEPSAEANRRARLRAMVASYAANHPAALRAALETAPEPAKPALRQAIAVSEAGYDSALKSLD